MYSISSRVSGHISLVNLKWLAKGVLIGFCQCFMETYTGDLAKACTNKTYQEKEERYTMNNENQCILLYYQ